MGLTNYLVKYSLPAGIGLLITAGVMDMFTRGDLENTIANLMYLVGGVLVVGGALTKVITYPSSEDIIDMQYDAQTDTYQKKD